MSAVNSLLWCFQYSNLQKKKKLTDSASPNDATNPNNNDAIDDGSYTSSDDEDDDDDDDFFDDDDDATEIAITKSDGSVDESAINAKDEYLNKLKKEYSQGEVEGQSDDLFGLSELPVIRTTLKLDQFEFNMEGVAKMGVHKVVVCTLVEAESKGDEGNNNNNNNNSGGINIMDSLLTSTYTVEFSLGSVNLISMIPSAYTHKNKYIHNYAYSLFFLYTEKVFRYSIRTQLHSSKQSKYHIISTHQKSLFILFPPQQRKIPWRITKQGRIQRVKFARSSGDNEIL